MMQKQIGRNARESGRVNVSGSELDQLGFILSDVRDLHRNHRQRADEPSGSLRSPETPHGGGGFLKELTSGIISIGSAIDVDIAESTAVAQSLIDSNPADCFLIITPSE